MALGALLLRIGAVGALVIALVGGVVYVSGASQTLAAARADPAGGPHAPAGGPATPKHDPLQDDPQFRTAAAKGHFRWSAVSPATHKGDHYTITLTNGATAQQVALYVMLMDHRAHQNTPELREIVSLAPGERRSFEADNNYGVANHWATRVATDTKDITWDIAIKDGGGTIAAFNQRGFLQFPDDGAPGHAAKAAQAGARPTSGLGPKATPPAQAPTPTAGT